MKRLNMALFIALIVVLFSTSVAAQHTSASAALDRSPEIVVREFYRWYIHALSHEIDPLKAGKATLKKYVTVRFIREIERNEKLAEGEGFDADYFLQTQDPLPSSAKDEAHWLKHISVSKVVVQGPTATAIVTFLDGYPKVKVSLIQEGGAWKINACRSAISSSAALSQNDDTDVINKFISKQASNEGGDEYEDARKVMVGDLNGGDTPDLAVLYTIEGQNGTNNYVQYLAVFVRVKGRLTYLTHTTVGGKSYRAVELQSIRDKVIFFKTLKYGPHDPASSPSQKGSTRYVLVSRRLKEL